MARSRRSGRGGRGRLRVVAGRAGGRPLESLPGEATRPTTERVREAVFSSLGAAVHDASVLDLYAGTGAMAIEALSRGAAAAVLVDHDRAAAAVCRRNLAATGFADVGRVVETSVAAFLALPPPAEAPFTIVTLDAPYATASEEIDAALTALTARPALATPGLLVPDAIAVVERGLRTPVDPVPSGWRLRFARAYGDTLVTLLTAGESDPAA